MNFEQLVFDYRLRRSYTGDPDRRALDMWQLRVSEQEFERDEEVLTRVAEVTSYGFDPYLARLLGEHPWEVADAHTGDTAKYFNTLFTLEGEPTEALLEVDFATYPSSALVLDEIWVAPERRGLGLARLAAAEAILTLSRAYDFVACYPAHDRDEDEGSTITQNGLRRLVESLGFVSFEEGLWVADVDLLSTLDKLEAARLR